MIFDPPSDVSQSSLSLDVIESWTTQEGDCVTAQFGALRLTSVFQPIFSVAHRRQVGYECLLRAFQLDGTLVEADELFHAMQTELNAVLLDRLCRNVHLRNFMMMSDETSWVFVNVSPHTVIHGRQYGNYFAELLQRYDIPAHRVVVEILEGDIHDEAMLAEAVDYYKKLGCLIAIDDFGAGHSNFERIWRIAPNIVKLDRSVITQAAQNNAVARVLPNLVNLIHESGSLALIEGIESEDEALLAMSSGCDFVQGFYFSKPAENLVLHGMSNHYMTEFCGRFKDYLDGLETKRNQALGQYLSTFKDAADRIQAGVPVAQACAEFLSDKRAERCFFLDHEGLQLDKNMVSPTREKNKDLRFLPVSNAEGGNWSRRHYFRRAVNNPGEVQVSRPYLSITEANLCITLSIAISLGNDMRVFCCDLDCLDK